MTFSPLRAAFSCCNCYFVAWPGCCDGRSHASNRIFQELLLNFAIFKYLSRQRMALCVIMSLAPPGQRLLDTRLHIFLGWHALVVFRLCKGNTYSKFVDIVSMFLFTMILMKYSAFKRNILWMLLFVVPRIMWSKHVISLNTKHPHSMRIKLRWHDD